MLTPSYYDSTVLPREFTKTRLLPPNTGPMSTTMSTPNPAKLDPASGSSLNFIKQVGDDTAVQLWNVQDDNLRVTTKKLCNRENRQPLLVNSSSLVDVHRVRSFTAASEGKMSEAEVWRLTHSVAHTLEGLHRVGLIHRDVKADHVLVREGCFALSGLRMVTEASKWRQGDDEGDSTYMAPELLNSKTITCAVDMFSLGVMLLELVSGEKMLPNGKRWQELRVRGLRELESDGDNAFQIRNELKELVMALCSVHPAHRPSAACVLKQSAFHVDPTYRLPMFKFEDLNSSIRAGTSACFNSELEKAAEFTLGPSRWAPSSSRPAMRRLTFSAKPSGH